MTDTKNEVREQVRSRYAAAATAVTRGNRDALAVVDADQSCCGPAENVSCCGGSGEVDDAFGAGLYSADEQGELPAEALAASLGCGNPIAVACLLFQRAFWAFSTDKPHHTIKHEFPAHLYHQGVYALIASIVALLVAQWFFNRFDERIAEQI